MSALPKLQEFVVQGWLRQDGKDAKGRPLPRQPLSRAERIKATSGYLAARQYARSHGVRDQDWHEDGSLLCVIRVG